MTPFRQTIRPGDNGLDVVAVKRVLRKRGYKDVSLTPMAGDGYVKALEAEQRKHKLHADGVYGPATHAIIANGFDKYGAWLYTHAAIRYVNPLRAATVQANRTDQGVDYHGSGPILALGDATVVGLGGAGWPGGQYLLYRLSNGAHAGRYVYVAEGIIPAVGRGQKVRAGDTVAHFSAGGGIGRYPGIETGWGSPTLNLTWAAVTTGYREGQPTEAGRAFARLLKQLGAPIRDDPGPGPTFPTSPAATLALTSKGDAVPTPPVPVPPLVSYLIAVVTAVAALLLGQGLIDNGTEKLVEGLAAIILPAAYVLATAVWQLAHALTHGAHSRIQAAQITAAATARPPTVRRAAAKRTAAKTKAARR